MRLFLKEHAIYLLIVLILNCIIVSDYFYHGNKSANFDAIAHITTIAQFHKALTDGEFPVGWGDGFANYGLPLGTIAHQIPAYTGALLTFITHDPLLSFNIVYLVSSILSALFFYWFLTLFFSKHAALLATIFYSLAPYRIMNLYMRGAMPEFASAVWVPLFLVALYKLRTAAHVKWLALFLISAWGLIMTHPMMLIIYAPIIALWMLFTLRQNIKWWAGIVVAGLLAVGLSAYYFLPLNLESKYLYHGITKSHYARNQTTTLDSFINPFWKYNCVYRNDIFGRCHLVKAGVTETMLMISLLGVGIMLLTKIPKNKVYSSIRSKWQILMDNNERALLFWFTLIAGAVSIALSTNLFEPVYERVRILGNIQYPWRFLSAYLFFPPIALAFLFEYIRSYRWSKLAWYILIAAIVVLRFPQLYGKNYTHVPVADYYFTPVNLHSFIMNPIWTGDSIEYPIRREKAEIIVGKGAITSRTLKNASREYIIQANTPLQVTDNTFYFPGWKVYIDGVPKTIEFQDPAHRGVITFAVPEGTHVVRVVFEDTKIRLAGKFISILTSALILFVLGIVVTRNKRSFPWKSGE